MAPLKFENQLKDKLEKRRLQPSDNAWEKLSNRLDNEEKRNNNKSFWWLGIAASIIGILFVVSHFFNNNLNSEEERNVVSSPKVETIQEEQESIKIASENETIKLIEDVKAPNETQAIQQPELKKSVKNNISSETKVAVSKPSKQSNEAVSINTSIELPKPTLTFEEQKVQDVVAQVQALKESNNEVTDADIDALLAQAQKEIKLNRLANETTGVVDANRLLQDVEAELDQSFRSKVFEAIKSSYGSVKTAVAQRNN